VDYTKKYSARSGSTVNRGLETNYAVRGRRVSSLLWEMRYLEKKRLKKRRPRGRRLGAQSQKLGVNGFSLIL